MRAGQGSRPQIQQVVRDPFITRGGLRVLQRTDGVWIVFDPALPIGQKTVAVADNPQAATARAVELAEAIAAEEAKCGSSDG